MLFVSTAIAAGSVCVTKPAHKHLKQRYHLSSPLVGTLSLVVDAREVGDDEGHGECDHQDSRERAYSTDALSENCRGHHVTVTEESKNDLHCFSKATSYTTKRCRRM